MKQSLMASWSMRNVVRQWLDLEACREGTPADAQNGPADELGEQDGRTSDARLESSIRPSQPRPEQP